MKMRMIASIVKQCDGATQDYYQEGYENATDLLIKFLKKEGQNMTETRIKAGFEKVYEELKEMKAGLEEEIRRAVAEKSADIDNMIASCTYEVEVDDFVEDVATENPSQEENVDVVEEN